MKKPACTVKEHLVKPAELPLSCPRPGQEVWNAHPKVYLPVEEAGGKVECPYCGTLYALQD